ERAYTNEAGISADMEYSETDAENSDGFNAEAAEEKENNTADIVRKEMLVYSCNMTVDVLDFDSAVSSFRESLDTYDAFVETENYSDNGSSGRWQYSDEIRWKTYTATVRVPSEKYSEFCDTASSLGDLRSRNASVQNLSSEYYDISTTLEIYETREKRYKELLSNTNDESRAMSVEKQLADIQIEIAKLKTRMKDINTDVAYSYVNISLNEVREYSEEPVRTDTFFQRLSNTISKASSSFLSTMEKILFALIYILPHALVIVLVLFVIAKIVKSIKRFHTRRTDNSTGKSNNHSDSDSKEETNIQDKTDK
ncbi:MAG: DUF4349 domain-containing protein, partial [Ruminococcus sp.]|nr:DUF4349 domain-containing protein [Ruminococcus sp.]